MEPVHMKLHPEMLRAAAGLARQRDITLGQMVRDLLAAEISKACHTRPQEKGYVLRAAVGGLALHKWPGEARICKASELGFSYSKLMRRFCQPFPGHGHTWLFDRVMVDAEKETGASVNAPEWDVIERPEA